MAGTDTQGAVLHKKTHGERTSSFCLKDRRGKDKKAGRRWRIGGGRSSKHIHLWFSLSAQTDSTVSPPDSNSSPCVYLCVCVGVCQRGVSFFSCTQTALLFLAEYSSKSSGNKTDTNIRFSTLTLFFFLQTQSTGVPLDVTLLPCWRWNRLNDRRVVKTNSHRPLSWFSLLVSPSSSSSPCFPSSTSQRPLQPLSLSLPVSLSGLC